MKKNLTFELLLDFYGTWGQANGQEGRGAENTIVLFYVVVFVEVGNTQQNFTYYNLQVQWSNDEIAEASAMKQWRKRGFT